MFQICLRASLRNRATYLSSRRYSFLSAARDSNVRAVSSAFPHGDHDGKKINANVVASMAILSAMSASIMISKEVEGNAKCCGIAAVVGGEHLESRDFLIEALSDCLKHRGYDSAGLATTSSDPKEPLAITKFANTEDKGADSIDMVKLHSLASVGHNIGISHTRWATHGGKTDANAHPHTDSSGKIAIVHNGTFNNANELRNELQKLGHKFNSQTDTEVVAKLIGHYRETKKLSVKDATQKALSRCVGTWGLCVMCSDSPSELVVACNGSPMVIGVSDDRTFVASEVSAFSRYTKNFINMKDGEIGVVHADGRALDLSRMEEAPDEEVKLSPDPYSHWTIKEIAEQPEAIARALGFGGRLSSNRIQLGGLDTNFDVVSKVRFMTLCGCGSSLNAAKYAEKLMKQLGSFDNVITLDASDMDVKDFPVTSDPKETGLIATSQSGETKDVFNIINAAMGKDLTVMSVVNSVGSLIARTTKLGVYCHAGPENALSSTKAFATEVTVLALMALWFRQTRDSLAGESRLGTDVLRLREALMRLPITFGMCMKTRGKCQKIAQKLKDKEHCFVLGKGLCSGVTIWIQFG